MDVWFRFLLAALATWRLAFLLAREDGPGRVFARLRVRLGRGFFGQLFGCVKCVGLWVSVPFAFFVGGDWVEVAVTWLALAGAAALIDEWTRPPFEWREDKGDDVLRTGPDRPAD
jgi:hypothetical protein